VTLTDCNTTAVAVWFSRDAASSCARSNLAGVMVDLI
jgi:hypothetical protein